MEKDIEGKRNHPNPQDWLGGDLITWSQSIRNGYIRAYTIFALLETGVFAALKNGEKKSAEKLSQKCNIEPYLLDGILNFLVYSDIVLEKTENLYFLTDKGREYLFTDVMTTLSWGAVGGYSCILTELIPALRREKKYGEDFIRRGDYVAISSQATGNGMYSWVVSELARLNVETVLDLGCGTAGVLINFCQINPNLKGIGVDIDARAIEEATRRVKVAGMEDRIKLVEGDITKPETYQAQAGHFQAINSIMAMHEFLRDSEDFVVDILKDMKAKFPGVYFLLGEVDTYSDSEIMNIPYPNRIHYLFYQYMIHPLTWQGMPMPKENWVNLFQRAGLEIIKVKEDLPSLLRLVGIVGKF